MRILNCPMEVKELSDTGSFEGLASTYGGTPDLGGDIIAPGAFKEFKLTKDGQIRILDGHNPRAPIGKGLLTDTHIGLAIKGKLNLGVSQARNVYEMMKDGVSDGLSIGFDVLPGGQEIKDGIRTLTKLLLWEVSVTVFPMNESALIGNVKAASQITNIREFEDFLRDSGFSKAQAVAIAAGGWKTLQGRRDSGEADDAKQVIDFLSNLKFS